MMSLRELIRRVWYLIRRDRVAADLEEEMRLHIEMRAARLEQSGLSASEARYAARRRFGNVTATEEASRDVWGFASVDQLVQDLRYATRRLRQRPGFSIPVIAVLALGIGATTAVFSAVDAAILRPLPFSRPHELVTLPNVNIPFEEESNERFPIGIEDIVAMPDLFRQAAGFASGGLNLSDPEKPLRLRVGVVTVDFFSTFGTHPQHGRAFTPEEGKPRAPAVTVLSHALWQRHFGGREMLGERILLHGKPHTVVGVMRPGFSFPSESDLWIPLSVPTTPATFEPFRGWLPSQVVARLAPGVTAEAASARLFARWQQLAAQTSGEGPYVAEMLNELREQGAVIPLQRELVGDRQRPLLVLLGATVLLLLIACANVANLLLSDAAVRHREIAVRETLGATRKRIVGQLLAESGLLAVGGAALGILLAPAALRVLRAMLPASLAGVTTAQLDLRVLAFATALALFTAVAFGLWPALGATRGDVTEAVRSGSGHGATASGKAGRARRTLIAAELALAVMLLVAAVLMLRSFARLMSEDLGLDPGRVATLEMSFPDAVGRAARLRTINAALERLNAQPGIQAAGAVNDLPLRGGGGLAIRVEVEGAPPMGSTEERPLPRFLNVSGGYFKALGIPLLRGRTFTPANDSLAPHVVIINQMMAKTYLPGLNPIGRALRFPRDSVPTRIVGVVGDVREAGLDKDAPPQMFFPIDARTPGNVALVARGTLPPRQLLATLVEAVRTADPAQPVFNVRMMDEVIGKSVAPRRTNTILIATFAALALLLSALGVYSVVAYGVAQRTREFGIRAAFGATGRDLVGLVSREMVGVVVIGTVIGLAAAWALSRILAALLYGVEPHDPATFAIVPLLMLLPALVATLLPALRAARVSPSEVMRGD